MIFSIGAAQFGEESLSFSRPVQIGKDTAIEPGDRLDATTVATQEFLCDGCAVVMCDQRGAVDTQIRLHGLHKIRLFHKRIAMRICLSLLP
jgi:hypothetical protein